MSEENIRKEHKISDSTPESVELSIDAMDKVAGGITDSEGHWMTTIAFGCGKWEEADEYPFVAIKGKCGSCKHWTIQGAIGQIKSKILKGSLNTVKYCDTIYLVLHNTLL